MKLLVIKMLLVVIGASQTTAQHCRTSRGIEGECISRDSCESFKEVQTRTFFTELSPSEKKDYLITWRCPSRSTLVCCPNDIPYSEPPPSVEGHKNLRLLPPLGTCGKSSAADRLHGGNKTDLLEYPWMARISTQNTSGAIDFTCSGTVINDRYILTAAHCIAKLPNLVLLGVRLGEWDASTETDCDGDYCAPPYQDIAIEEVLPHPGYVGFVSGLWNMWNDIGLLRLASPINLTVANVVPICLPTTKEMREANLEDKELVITGWGKSNRLEDGSLTYRKDFSNPRLLQIAVPIVSNRLCAEKYNSSREGGIGFRHLCAGGQEGISSCNGDSGGPMGLGMRWKRKYRFVQYGVVSAGYSTCGVENQPSIFTNVVHYMDWILDTIKQ